MIVLDSLGQAVRSTPLSPPAAIISATRSAGTWFIGTESGDGRFVLYRLDNDRFIRLWTPGESGAFYRLGPNSAGVASTFLKAPYNTTLIATDGRFVCQISPGGILADTTLVGMRLLELPTGFLQTFVDIRSSRRVLVIYDAAGQPVRTTAVRAPLSFFQSMPGNRLLFGVRYVDEYEIVTYQVGYTDMPP